MVKKKRKIAALKTGWKIIFKYLLNYRGEMILLSGLGIISALANGVVPYVTGRFFDAIIAPSAARLFSLPSLPFWALFMTVWAFVQIIANVTDWRLDVRRARFGNVLYGDYIARGFSYLLLLPVSFHKDKKSGKIGDLIGRSANWLVRIVENVIIELAPRFLSVIVGVVVVLFIKPEASAVLFAGIIIYTLLLLRVAAPAASLQRQSHRAYSEAFGSAYDALYNVETVKQFTAERHEAKSFSRKFIDVAAKLSFNIDRIWSTMGFYQRMIVTLTQLAIFFLSIYAIFQGRMTPGELIALNGYAAMIFGPFVTLGYNWQTIQNGVVAVEQAERVLSAPTERYMPPGTGVQLKHLRGEVEFRHVSFRYGVRERTVLRRVSFTVRPGEVIALVGESGVGKSTIASLLSGYYFPSSGNIFIDGHDISTLDLVALRSRIAVVPQEVLLFNGTVRMNIRYGNFTASQGAVRDAAREAYADKFIEQFPRKYSQIVGERGVKLSVGQKQRIAIARAILRDPAILILDEPTSALDIQTEQDITTSLERLMKGRTTFIIAHRLSTVRRADRILVFEKGNIVEEGTHDALIAKNGIYAALYRLHTGLH